jgi:hypothetical protein
MYCGLQSGKVPVNIPINYQSQAEQEGVVISWVCSHALFYLSGPMTMRHSGEFPKPQRSTYYTPSVAATGG